MNLHFVTVSAESNILQLHSLPTLYPQHFQNEIDHTRRRRKLSLPCLAPHRVVQSRALPALCVCASKLEENGTFPIVLPAFGSGGTVGERFGNGSFPQLINKMAFESIH